MLGRCWRVGLLWCRRAVSPAFVVLALVTALSLLAAPAWARELHVEQFDAQIAIDPDGSIEATEKIRARFVGAWQGLYRTIPIEYRTPQGLNFTLWLDVLRVTDGSGAPLTYETSRERHYRKLKILLPDAVDATKTIVVTYRVRNALRFFEDHDELYWNVTGDQWDVPIDGASARIVLPAGVTGLRATEFTGAYGSRAHDAEAQVGSGRVDVHTGKPLGFHEGLTVAVAWDKGFVREPSWLEKVALFMRSNWPLSIPIIALGVMAWLWYVRGRDPRLRPKVPRYKPPAGLTPAEVGTLLDDSVDMRDISATILDLAVRGFLRIEEAESSKLIQLFASPEYVFHLRKRPDEWLNLKPHERLLLSGLFSDGTRDSVSLSDLENVFYKNLPGIRDSIFESLLSDHYYAHRPDEVRRRYVIAGIVVGVLITAGGILALFKLGMAPLSFFVAAGLSALIICGFARIMPARTERGARALEEILGFEEYLGEVDPGRFEHTARTPEMFESFLPFAMAFGIEKKWAKAFQSIYTQSPLWYGGYGGLQGPNFRVYDFVGNLNRMTRHVGSTLGSAPRSSGGSGSSGGSSGGGSGGGGGGGF
jgi:uncharacterized membrane protein YgcG